MAVVQKLLLAAALLLVAPVRRCTSGHPGCPEPCTCQSSSLVNCSSSGLSLVPQRIHDSVSDLDLSHNLLDSVTLDRPRLHLKNAWLGDNSITRLSLCMERFLGTRTRYTHRLRPWSRRGCVSWAPTLQLLSVERNQLDQLPEGLEGSESLHVLQLSYNKISTLRPEDLSHLPELIELHLQHNHITSLHPQTFQDLVKLRVLDLSFNNLTSLHPVMYRSLRSILSDVQLAGNKWLCDCTMRSLRRWMISDSSRGQQTWSVFCTSPSILSGRDLLQLKEDDLNCLSTENRLQLHQDVTVYSGSELLLSCSSQGSMWTPNGKAPLREPQAGLLITDVTERDAGLYVCMSEEQEVVSVFNLQISKVENARRISRSLSRSLSRPKKIIPQGTPTTSKQENRNQRASQSDLALAVCLSVFFTFLVAFVLGILARPCIDVLWRRVTNKKSSTETDAVSSVEHRQYDNEAYSNVEEPEVISVHRERRVTFSTVDIREASNVRYYDTVESDEQESINNDVAIEGAATKDEKDSHTAEDSENEKSFQQSGPGRTQRDGRDVSRVTEAGCQHEIEFEHIPESVAPEKRSLSAHSDSSLYDQVCNEDRMTQNEHTKPKSAKLGVDSVQQTVDVRTETAQISTDGTEVSGCSSDPFSDWSPHTKNHNLRDQDHLWKDDEEQFEFSDSVQSTSARSSSVCGFSAQSKFPVLPASDEQKGDVTSSSSSCISEDEPTEYTVNYEEERVKRKDSDDGLQHPIHSDEPIMRSSDSNKVDTKSHAESLMDSCSSHTSDSDGEDAIVKQQVKAGEGKGELICVSDMLSSSIDTGECDITQEDKPTPHSKWRVLSLNAISWGKGLHAGPSSTPEVYSSSSSSESEAEVKDLKGDLNTRQMTEGIKTNEEGRMSSDLDRQSVLQIKTHLNINVPGAASSPSPPEERMDGPTKHSKEEEQGGVAMEVLSVHVVQSENNNTKLQRLSQDLGRGSEVEASYDTVRQGPGKVNIVGLPLQESQKEKEVLQTISWPEHDAKMRLDIKPPSPASHSSSSSDSEDETPSRVSQIMSEDLHTQWPEIDLKNIVHIKKRLDIKPPSPDSESSSSSDSEEKEATTQLRNHRPGNVNTDILETKFPQTKSRDPDTRWSQLNLKHNAHLKKRLDIKPPPPASHSSSSSGSEDETPNKVSQIINQDPQTRWPELDQTNIVHLKKRLDIKPPSPDSESSSKSDSEDEAIQIDKLRPVQAGLPFQETQKESRDPDKQWPQLDLKHTAHIKTRLDIKPTSPASHSSSSSDSEDETPRRVSQIMSDDLHTRWPEIDLKNIVRIKKRLDIKPPSMDSESSSSSDSEDETSQKATQRPDQVGIAGFPFQESRHPDQRWPEPGLRTSTIIKGHVDIKPPSRDSESSSSNDSEEEEATAQLMNHRPGNVNTDILETKFPQTKSRDPDTRWPQLDLKHAAHIKTRLDIKPPPPASPSSSSSDSEDETPNQIKKQDQSETLMPRPSTDVSQIMSQDLHTCWPELDPKNIVRIKRRLDIKPPSSDSDSSSSSDSEDGILQHKRPEWTGLEQFPIQESPKANQDRDARWPAVDLGSFIRIKRRLDVKAALPLTAEGERKEATKIEYDKGECMEDFNVLTRTVEQDPDSRWPKLSLSSALLVGRRLDIRTNSPDLSSSSSENEHVTTAQIEKERARTDMEITDRPDLNLSIPFIKRRLNIETPLQPADSSNGVNECRFSSHTVKHETNKVVVEIGNDDQRKKTSLEHLYVKRSLDIKAPQAESTLRNNAPGSQSTLDSSTSDSEDETQDHVKLRLGISVTSRATEKVLINTDTYRSPKTDHNTNLEKYIAITDDVGDATTYDNINTTPEINPEFKSQWDSMNLGVSRFRKRIKITSPTQEIPNLPSTPPPGSPFSSITDKLTGGIGDRTSRKGKDLATEGIILTKSSPKDENENVSLSSRTKGIVDTDILDKAEEKSNPERTLADFVTPHLKKQQDIKVSEKTPAGQPEQQLHASSSSSENEEASTEYVGRRLSGRPKLFAPTGEEAMQTESSSYIHRSINVRLDQSQTKWRGRLGGVELKGQTSKLESSHTAGTKIRRTMDIRGPLQNENEANDNGLGVPDVSQCPNIQPPSPEQSSSSSSSSESENDVKRCDVKQTGHESVNSELSINESFPYYKRSVFQPSLPPSNSFSHSAPTKRYAGTDMATVEDKGPSLSAGVGNSSLSQVNLPSMRFDDVVRQRIEQSRRTTEDLPSGIRWTSKDHQSTGVISRTHPHVPLSSPQPFVSSMHFRREREYQMIQDRVKADWTRIHTSSSFSDSSGPLPSSKASAKSGNTSVTTNESMKGAPGDRRARRGLSALKVMSSERKKWDLQAEYLDKVKTPFDNQGPKVESSFSYPRTEGIKSLSSEPQTQLNPPSISSDDRHSAELLYDIPRYRRHDFGGVESTPPLSAKPPPDGSVELTWKSPQRGEKQGLESTSFHLQQEGNVAESDLSSNMSENLAVYLDSSNNISYV